MGCYYTLYLNTYGYYILFYKVYHEEGGCRQLEFWLEKGKHRKPILHCSKNPETPRNLFLELIRIIERKKHLRGPTPWPGGWGERPPLLGAPPVSWAPWWPSGVHLLLYEGFYPGKYHGQDYGTKLLCHEAEPI